jgi:hypothetical protein
MFVARPDLSQTESPFKPPSEPHAPKSRLNQRWASVFVVAWVFAGGITMLFVAIDPQSDVNVFDKLYRMFGFAWLPVFTFVYAGLISSIWCRFINRGDTWAGDAGIVALTGTTAPMVAQSLFANIL